MTPEQRDYVLEHLRNLIAHDEEAYEPDSDLPAFRAAIAFLERAERMVDLTPLEARAVVGEPIAALEDEVWHDACRSGRAKLREHGGRRMADPCSIDDLIRALVDAQRKSTTASDARAALPAGSSRARVTTANARWMRAAEERDRCEADLRSALERAGVAELRELHVAAEARIDAAYWAFTRQARTVPPAVAVPGSYRLRTMIDDEVRRRGEVVAHG